MSSSIVPTCPSSKIFGHELPKTIAHKAECSGGILPGARVFAQEARPFFVRRQEELPQQTSPLSARPIAGARMALIRTSAPLLNTSPNGTLERLSASAARAVSV